MATDGITADDYLATVEVLRRMATNSAGPTPARAMAADRQS
jgi:hypothetical protein